MQSDAAKKLHLSAGSASVGTECRSKAPDGCLLKCFEANQLAAIRQDVAGSC